MRRDLIAYRRQGLRLVSLILMAALLLMGSLHSVAAPPPRAALPYETVSLPPEARSWTPDAMAAPRASRHPQLDSAMADLAAAADGSIAGAQALAGAQSLRLSDHRVQVQIVTHSPGLQRAIRAVAEAGGEVTVVGRDETLIQGWLPIGALEAVAAHDDVYLIRRPAELVVPDSALAGNSTTEGFDAMNGPAWHTAGYTGRGIRIGIIDGGFEGYPDLLETDLPASVTVRNFVDGESDAEVDATTKHGTAVAEIVHDVAPDATLYLAKIATNLDLQQAVAWLVDTQQVDIIVTGIIWYNATPGDGTGEFADLVQEARSAGVLWVTAGGNGREHHWGGLYYDPEETGSHHYGETQNVNFFGPGDGQAYAIPAGYQFQVLLRWDDWTDVDQDYDLYLLRWNDSSWEVVAESTNVQNGGAGQRPTEFASITTSGSATVYGFVIVRQDSDRAVNLEVFAPGLARLDRLLHARSLGNLADAPGAMTVAALDVTSPYSQEPYSAEGPTNGPGGSETGGFLKPDLAAFANVSTESYGTTGFSGTSAATSHVGGAAALVMSAHPSYTPDQVQTFLEARAVDMGQPGMDTLHGFGRLHLGDPDVVDDAPVVAQIEPDSGADTGVTHVTLTGAYFADGATVNLQRVGEADILATNVDVVMTTTITCEFDLTGATRGAWNVIVTNPDERSGQMSDGFTVVDGQSITYLPLLLRNFPLVPDAPVLGAIDNPDGIGTYTISWSASEGAETYLVQEATAADFSNATTAYSGPSTSAAISGRDIGTYYYRVRASNPYASSDWSNPRSVEVTVPPPPCPQAGPWSGTTSQGRAISFEVAHSPRCEIAAETLQIGIHTSCGYSVRVEYAMSYPITDHRFETTSSSKWVGGEFTSPTTASGTFDYRERNPFDPFYPGWCTASGTWTATP